MADVPFVPQNGDLVVRMEVRDQKPVFLLRVTPGPDQFIFSTRHMAVAQASRYAKQRQVCVWMDIDGAFTIVESFRVSVEPV